jgi:hypothetical protein
LAVQWSSAREAEKRWRYTQLSVEKNSAGEAVNIEPERGNLKNLQCYQLLLGNG